MDNSVALSSVELASQVAKPPAKDGLFQPTRKTPRQPMKRTTLENLATSLGYELSAATSLDELDSANAGEGKPRWTLNPIGNVWANRVKRCGTLAEVADELDHIEIAKS